MYQALYRKYRPQTFDEVVGQKSVTDTLKSQVQSGRLSHAYLFTGSRGTGKTSCAKILAKAVNCENPVDGNPCNRCAACRAIDAASCMDVLEIDAASNNGVDNVRALRDDAIYSPAEVKKRVYIIDEVHMLSMSAFNALLKIIEEPPAHLLFILATTELHKVPATILSRCQRFSFRRPLPEEIASRVNYIAYQEGIEIEDAALRLLARLADGAFRDGISLLDQCASALSGSVTVEGVYRCLGLAGEKKTYALMQAVAEKNTAAALKLFSEQYAAGKDIAAMLDELCALARDLLLVKTAPKSGLQMLSGVSTDDEMEALLPKFTSGELLRIASVLQETAAGFRTSTNRRIDTELCLLRLCEPALELELSSVNARLTRVEETIASGCVVQRAEPKAKNGEKPADDEEERPPFPDDADAPLDTAAADAPVRQPTIGESVDFWPELVAKLKAELRPPASGFFATTPNAPVRGQLRGDMLTLVVDNNFIAGMVDKQDVLAVVRQKAAAILHKPVGVCVRVVGDTAADMDVRGLEKLISFGNAHPDVVHIEE